MTDHEHEHQHRPHGLRTPLPDEASVRRVFGTAYERDGVLVIPVAAVAAARGTALARARGRIGRIGLRHARLDGHGRRGGAEPEPGAGATADAAPGPGDPLGEPGTRPAGHDGHGRHGGAGRADADAHLTRVTPAGVYVVDDTGVHWRPALDVNRVIVGGQAVGALVGVTLAWAVPLALTLRRRRG